ncbi:glycoside hydrolase family 2 protein [Gorillibacterium timonense]|uniref:glycoside hydrolase family 2 protein n=1 Tax=Gorillibacterium timonense TaxID=1689269 RepID=UPI0009E93E3A|nr:sugar-binding domain-containing protein [Gorillibacterium timonense]
MNLNGEWEFEKDPGNSGVERKFYNRTTLQDKIIVPFAPESRLSGIEDTDFMQTVWYRRTFAVKPEWQTSGRTLLHFGAVDYTADVWVNGKKAGTHNGGYTPFALDVTALVQDGENVVVVRAFDDVKNPLQPTGKQSPEYHNFSCLYTRSTGIWQTVWLEHVPSLYIQKLRLTPDVDNECLRGLAVLNEYAGGQLLSAEATLDGNCVSSVKAKTTGTHVEFTLPIADPKLWNPGSPVLYDLVLQIGEDRVESYFGMRKVEIHGGAIEINGVPVFQRLILDQGYYPDGIYTAPSDEALEKDIDLAMAAGFNGARLHMKIFEPRLLYHADRKGYLVWGEYPNWGLSESDPRALQAMLPEWIEELERDYNHPAIVGWCPFNETGTGRLASLFRTVYDVTKAIDPTRPVIDTSGYVHAITDIYDVHDYDQDPVTFAKRYEALVNGGEVFQNFPEHETYEGQPYFVSEFGGIYWNETRDDGGWGYGQKPADKEEFIYRYEGMINALLDNSKICAFCYTQLTDVMQEQNGLYDFDRQPKFDVAWLHSVNTKKAAIEKLSF